MRKAKNLKKKEKKNVDAFCLADHQNSSGMSRLMATLLRPAKYFITTLHPAHIVDKEVKRQAGLLCLCQSEDEGIGAGEGGAASAAAHSCAKGAANSTNTL